MSTSTPRTNLETRRQLEELDALIQRMLSMPLAGEEPTPATVTATSPPPPPPSTQTVSAPVNSPTIVIHPIPGETPPAGMPSVRAWRVEMPTPQTTLPTPETPLPYAASVISPVEAQLPPAPRLNLPPISATPQPPTPIHFPSGRVYDPPAPPQPTLVVEPPMAEVLPSSVAGQPPLYPMGPVSANGAPPSALLLPVIGLNRLMDVLLLVLGPFGLWLRSSVGRNIVGWLGILLIFGAAAWAIRDRFGLRWPL